LKKVERRGTRWSRVVSGPKKRARCITSLSKARRVREEGRGGGREGGREIEEEDEEEEEEEGAEGLSWERAWIHPCGSEQGIQA